MFSTVNSVEEYTGAEVSLELIKRAQGIIEVFIGKDEISITNPDDLLILDKMTAYQAVYMSQNEDIVFKQVASTSMNSGDATQTYDTKLFAPFIAPLAVLASNGLSFKRGRSLKTGRIFQFPPKSNWRNS
jgi:hypothetical protein